MYLTSFFLQFTDAGKQAATNGKLKTKILLIGVRTAASVFLHATFESKKLLGEVLIQGVKSSVCNLKRMEGCNSVFFFLFFHSTHF
jgi:hypothetical protein